MKKFFITLFLFCLLTSSCICLNGCAKKFEVDFIVEDEVYYSIKTNGKENINFPEEPKRAGYQFDGWYFDIGAWKNPCTEGSFKKKRLTENVNIYAKWNILVYNIEYVLNGGENSFSNPVTYTVEDEITLHLPKKFGYYSTWSNNGVIRKGTVGNLTFTASYYPTTYAISYNCGLGENNEMNPSTYTIESENITLQDPFYINADFKEWQIEGQKISEIKKGSTGNLSLTAIWDPYDVRLELNSDKKGYTVIGRNTNKSEIIIEDSYHNLPVTAIKASAFDGCSYITKITLSKNLKEIGEYAFRNCSSLNQIIYTGDVSSWCNIDGLYNIMYCGFDALYIDGKEVKDELIIPENATRISQWAFAYCKKIKKVIIGDAVESIDDSAFSNCIDLESVTIGKKLKNIGGWAFDKDVNIKEIYYTANIGDWCQIKGLSEIMFDTRDLYIKGAKVSGVLQIPEGTKVIEEYAFYDCNEITSVIIPDSVVKIGRASFYKCDNIKEMRIPFVGGGIEANEGYDQVFGYIFNYFTTHSSDKNNTDATLQYYGNYVGYYYYYIPLSLTSVVIGNAATGVPKSAFKNCKNLTNVTIGNNVKEIGDEAFINCSKLISIDIPDSIIGIGRVAFFNCTDLKNLSLGNGVKNIGKEAFWNCIRLISLAIPESVETIDERAFFSCKGLREVIFNAKNCRIERSSDKNIFDDCSNIVFAEFGENVIHVPSYLFENCKSLKTVSFKGGVKKIKKMAFYSCDKIETIDLSNCITDEIEDYAFADCYGLKSFTFSKNLRIIGKGALYYCKNLMNIEIPDSVTDIKDDAFAGCRSISNIKMGENIENIGNGAFRGFEKISSINIPKKIINLGEGVFYGWLELKEVIWNAEACILAGTDGCPVFSECNKLETIVIGSSVKTIPSFAFYNCSGLVNVTIGANVTIIEELAFSGCDKLNNISFNGTIEQWNNIKKGKYYLYDTPVSQIVCSDGNVEL